jgi:DNA-binding response OmpR family regulator
LVVAKAERNYFEEAKRIYGFSRRKCPVMTRVLIVEDDPSVGAAIRLTLARWGTQALHVLDAETGIEAFESADFDLVIVDLSMPKMTGHEIIAKFRERAPTVPLLAMSGFRFRESTDPDVDYPGLAAKAGAVTVLTKPFTPDQLTTAIEAILGKAPADAGFFKTRNQNEDSSQWG